MAYKQSFQFFEAIMDDPPLKPPLAHGHYPTTLHEPAEDHSCYLCTDHQAVRAMASGEDSGPWNHFHTQPHVHQHTNKKVSRPEEAHGPVEGHHHHRQSKKVMLVMNSDPSVRRTIVLRRRSLRSLTLFMDEVSELMQCAIRKLYTLEGQKIDSVQTLLQCPGTLVCVGREPFHPLLCDNVRKNSYDKLPRLNVNSHSSVCSEEKAAKKNVNFGLETKKSVIHPRCESNTRPVQCPNGLNSLPPRHRLSGPHGRESTTDENIEKRVLVNKDGSMSMEMKVRFQLLNDETLHWSTEVKKSKGALTESYRSENPWSLSHGSAESFSEAESFSAGEAEETHKTKPNQRQFQESSCRHCCAHCHEYDSWISPMLPHQSPVRQIRSSSSSASSHRLICKKASTDSMRTMSSEEYTEHVIEKASCIQQSFGPQSNTTLEHCSINHCCRCSTSTKTTTTAITEKHSARGEINQFSDNDENKLEVLDKSKKDPGVEISQAKKDEIPPSSTMSSSQNVASLKEGEDLSKSNSRASHNLAEDGKDSQPNSYSSSPCLTPRPPSKGSSTNRSKTSRRYVPQDKDSHIHITRPDIPVFSNATSEMCKCVKSNNHIEDDQTKKVADDRASSAMSANSTSSNNVISTEFLKSETFHKTKSSGSLKISEARTSSSLSVKSNSSCPSKHPQVSNKDAGLSTNHNKLNGQLEHRPASSISLKSNTSAKSKLSIELSELEIEESDRAPSSFSILSSISKSDISDLEEKEPFNGETVLGERSVSSKSKISTKTGSKDSWQDKTEVQEINDFQERSSSAGSSENAVKKNKNLEERLEQTSRNLASLLECDQSKLGSETEKRASSAMSARSEVSTLSKSSEQLEERTSSAISAKSNVSARSNVSKISHSEGGNYQDKCDKASHNSKVLKIPNKDRPLESEEEKRSTSALSTKSHVSAKSYKSNVSDKADEDHTSSDKTERTPSALSSKSAVSAKSKKSEIQDQEERAQSALSATSIVSSRSNKSMTVDILSNGVNQEEQSSEETKDQIEERATSVVSSMSAVSAKSRRSESEERAPSAMSAKSIASTRSEKSKISECVSDGVHREEKSTEEQQDQLEERATSVISFISAISGISRISGQSEAQNQVEERAPSALSAKSKSSARSNMSKISDLQTDGVNQVERVLTPLSAISNMSRRSKLSDVSARAKDNNERTPSVMSSKSDLSTKSNSSKCKANRVSDESSHEVYGEEKVTSLPQTPTSAISINEERSASAVSVISEKSEAKSNKPEITIEEENNARPQSAVSVKSFVSAIIIEEPVDQNDAQALSSRSDTSGPDNLVNEEKENTERTESALSCFSDVSASSLKSSDSELRKNTDKNAISPTASHTSAESRRSNVSEEARRQTRVINAADLRPSSALSAKSCASQESKKSECSGQATSGELIMTERTASSLSKKSNGSSTSNAPQNSDKGRISKLSIKSDISTKSKKTKISEDEDHCNTLLNNVEIKINPNGPDCSDVSDKTNTCLCNCGEVAEPLSPTDSSEKHFDVDEPASPLSKNSSRHRISPSGSVSERVLTPTSTSVSIGIEEDNEVDDDEEANAVASKTLRSSASSKIETLKNDRTPSQSTLQLANERKTATPEERPISLSSANSNGSKKSKSKCSHCSASCYLDTNRKKSSKSNVFPSEFQPEKADTLCCSSSSNKADQTCEERKDYLDVAHECQSISSTSSTKTKENIPIALVESASPISSASFNSPDSGKSRINHDISDRPRSNMSGQNISVKALVNGIEQADQSQKTSEAERENSRCHSATLSIKSCNRLSPNPPKSPKKCKRSLILQASSNESMLSQTDSACHNREKIDHLNTPEEDITSNKSDGTQNNQRQTSNTNKCRKKLRSNSSCNKLDDGVSDLTPSCLPNASPTEVVNEWLRKIPSDSEMCQLGDELHENFNLVDSLCTTLVPSGDGHGRLEVSSVTKLETPSPNLDKAEDATNNVVEENLAISKDTIEHKPSESEHTVFDSSVLVMKVLLSPKLNRCHSLPEVSPTYGRKLSKSAQGLLDCLANLQLLDFGPSDKHCKEEKYQELMGMFKSLWLCDPIDSEKTPEETETKVEIPLDEENKAKSSSGVDINSGSTGSGNSSVVSSQPQTKINCEGPEVLTKVQEVDEPVEQESSAISDSKPNSNMCAESDSQQNHDLGAEDASEDQLKDDVLGSNETISNNDSPREIIETPLSSNQRETESDRQAETSSDSPSVLPKSQLTKRISQDPDPAWVLNLLNKLEKQFMAHYVSAMAEFKIRWNLDDNEQLDIMICELRDEVHRRIQSSVDRELRKIQGRAGRPRPPKETASRESSVQTDQRRRRLKVMRNQSIDPQRTKSDDYYTLTGTDFSDQRSDDEYCPCDTCVKKKMVSKQVLPIEMFNSAPVMMDFDLRRILYMKKSPSSENFERLNSECKANRIDEDNGEHEDEKDEEDATAETNTLEVTEAAEEDNTEEDSETADVVSADVQADEVDPTAEEDEVSENDKGETDEVDHNAEEAENVEINETTEDDETNYFDNTAEDDETAEDDNTADNETSKVDNPAEDEATEIDNTAEEDVDEVDNTAEDDHTDEVDEMAEVDNAAKEGKATEVDNNLEDGFNEVDNIAKEGETAKEDKAAGNDDETDEVDITAEEGETDEENKTAEDDETDEVDNTAEEGETGEANISAEKNESDEVDNTAEDGGTDEVDNAVEDGIDHVDNTADENVTDRADNTAEDDETDEADNTAEEGEIAEIDETAEADEAAKEGGATELDNTAEDGIDEVDNNAEEGETDEVDNTAEECETAKVSATDEVDNTEEDETAEADNTSGEDETAEADKTAEEDETAEDDNTAGEDETAQADKTAEEDETAEDDNKAGKDETAENDNAAEEDETAENDNAAEEDETAEADNAVEEDEIDEADNAAEEGEIAETDNLEDDETEEVLNTAEEGDTDEVDNNAEEDETAEADNTAGEDETPEVDNTAEEDETPEADNTVEEDEIDEADNAAEEGETAETDNLEDDETEEVVNTAEEGDTDEVDNNAEEDETAEADNTAGEDETPEVDNTAEEDETPEADNTAEEGETAEADNTVEEDETAEADNTAEEDKTDEVDNTAEEGETAEADNTAEEDETDEADNAAEEDETDEADNTTEEGETAEADNSAEDGETAEADNTAEEDETGEADNTAEEDETAETDNTAGGDETAEADNAAEEGETAEADNTAADDETEEADNTAEEGEADDVDNSAEEGETDEVDNMAEGDETDEVVSAAEGDETAEADNTAEEGETDEADNTAKEGETDEVYNTPEEDETDEAVSAAEEGETEEVVNTAEEETEEVVNDAEESETAEADNTAEEGETGEADNTAEDDEKDKEGETIEDNNIVEKFETVEPNEEASELTEKVKDCQSGVDEENKTGLKIEEETIENDIVALVTTEDKGKESGIDEDSEITTRNGIVANTGESAEAGDEAEDDTEPDIEIEGEQDGTSPALTSVLKPEHCDEVKDQKTVKILVNHNSESEDGAEADGEDSETEIRSIENNVSSELEENKVENTDEDETLERIGKDTDSSPEKKNASKIVKEKAAFLSDITEDTAEDEENQKNTDDVTTDSQVGEYESSENSLAKQMTKSSVESQPGSFDEVFNSQTKRSNHVAMDAN